MKGEMKYTPEDMRDFGEAYARVYQAWTQPNLKENMSEKAAESLLASIRKYDTFSPEVKKGMTIKPEQVSELQRMCENTIKQTT